MSGRGVELMKEAKAKSEASTFGSTFGFAPSKAQNMQDAGELYVKAGNSFKVGNLHDKAAEAFMAAYESFKQADGSGLEATNNLVEAGNCFRKAKNIAECIKVFGIAIEIYAEQGKFGYTAKYQREIADIFMEENNTDSALDYFQRACQSFQHDNKPSKVTECKLKIAVILSEKNDLTRAANEFEEVGVHSMENKLSSFSAKGYFLQCLLCHLAQGDSVAIKQKAEFFKGKDFSFAASREGIFIDRLLEAFEVQDCEAYATHCAEFDRVTPLDPWKTSMLLKGKEHIEEKEEDLA